MDEFFRQKTIVVTGAGRGLGKQVTKKLIDYGAQVIGLTKSEENVAALLAECPGVQVINCDITDIKHAKDVLENLPPVYGLVNCVGLTILTPFLKIKPSDFDNTFSTNVRSLIFVSQTIAKQMIRRNEKGCIINISAVFSKRAMKNQLLFSSSKAAVDAITRVMALELGQHNIRVNSVCPSIMLDENPQPWAEPKKYLCMQSRTATNKFPKNSEVAEVIIFLLSDKAAMCHGVNIPVDGGFLLT